MIYHLYKYNYKIKDFISHEEDEKTIFSSFELIILSSKDDFTTIKKCGNSKILYYNNNIIINIIIQNKNNRIIILCIKPLIRRMNPHLLILAYYILPQLLWYTTFFNVC